MKNYRLRDYFPIIVYFWLKSSNQIILKLVNVFYKSFAYANMQ